MSSSTNATSGLDILQLYGSNGGRYLSTSNLYLSEDGKEMFFLGGGEDHLPVSTHDATKQVFDSYTLASVYLLCLYPNDLRNYRKSCERANCIPVKATDKQKLLILLLGEDYYNEQQQQQQQQQDKETTTGKPSATEETTKTKATTTATATTNKEKKRHETEQQHRSKKHHRDHGKVKKEHHHQQQKGKESSINKKYKTSKLLSKDQVLENLTLVADKRSDKRQQAAPGLLEEETPTTTEHEGNNQQSQQQQQEAAIITTKFVIASTTDDEDALQKKKAQLRQLLSDKSFIVTDDEALVEDIQKTSVDIISMEIPVGDSFSILRAPGRDLSRVLEMYTEAIKMHSKNSSNNKTVEGTSKTSSLNIPRQKPIIIVPNTMTSPLTLINAIEFLSNAKYVTRDVMLKQRDHGKQQPCTFTRKISAKYASSSSSSGLVNANNANNSSNILEYEIMDNPCKHLKSRQDWERIVAVVALGSSWQFKGFYGKLQTPVELFNKVQGYYFGIQDNTTIPKECQGWNIKTILLSRDNRNLDGVAHAKFWNTLDEWMAIHKPELLPSS